MNLKFDSEFPAQQSVPLTANPHPSPTPRVSVLIITYNQQDYVRQAIESALMQKADYGYEIVVADDFSENSTPAILKEYETAYKNVRVLQTAEHLGITRNYQRGFSACRGEYVAVLEGDDYWISPNKLSLLALYLDQHPECAFCFHRIIKHDDVSDQVEVFPKFETRDEYCTFTARDLAKQILSPAFPLACTGGRLSRNWTLNCGR